MRDGPMLAAVGDVHATEASRARVETMFDGLDREADALLLAGDLTGHGEPAEAEILACAIRRAGVPSVAVLGNHDHHGGHADEICEVLRASGVTVLERGWTELELAGRSVGIVGAKGFIGGFPGSHLPDFGEPLLRRVYAETGADVAAIDEGLAAVARCDERVVLLHYAPTDETLAGEPEGIHVFLGCDRLAEPIVRHRPSLVLHGHAHMGTFAATLEGGVPVLNVAEPVISGAYALVALEFGAAAPAGVARAPAASP